ncbi:MAG: ABC transporter permease subunit, partial [Anaerolineae bacterium]|nr:ABC transporter permease subunit [Anaerolineae bacterium]
GDMGELDYTSPEGFLGIEFFSWAPLVLAVFGVTFGGAIVGGEEERGTLDVLLSTPIPRWQVIVEKAAAFVVALAVILIASGASIVIAVAITPDLSIDTGRIAAGMLNMFPTLLLMTVLALFLTTVLRSRGRAGGIAAGIIAASYFINSFASMADSGILKALQRLSFYSYYSPFTVLTDGIHWGNFALLMVVTIVLFGLSLFFFERRDLSV